MNKQQILTPKFPHVLHGADYYPEQWLNHPDILQRDLELMQKAHINCVSLGVFAWSALEPQEGIYHFDWMEKVIDDLYQAGVYTILATPSGARPAWMAQKYPEVLRVSNDLRRNTFGGRHNHCYTSPIYREQTRRMDTELARRFGRHPGVILWHLSNEYGGECFCPLCREAFRKWLKQRYGSLEALNDAWYTSFWSHTYTDWSQIDPPLRTGEGRLHALNLDWKRFVTHQTVDFCRMEAETVQSIVPELPVTTNMIGFKSNLNYSKFHDELNVIGWDSYPVWHKSDADDLEEAQQAAFTHDFMRSLKHQPFLLMESTPSTANWMDVSKQKRPGMHMLASMQAVAHGSNSVECFQWRQSRGGCEKFHSAVVDHYGGEDTRVFREVAEVGKRLKKLEELGLCSSINRPRAAVIFDWENRWAVEDAQGPRRCGIKYMETVASFHKAFWELGIPVDVVDMEADLSGYRLIAAPMLYLCRAGIQEKLKQFVRGGGTLVGTYHSGVVDESDLCYLGGTPGGMTDLFGLRIEEIDALYDGQANRMLLTGTHRPPLKAEYPVSELCEVVRCTSAKVLAEYGEDFYRGCPALTVNDYGQGRAYYLAARTDYALTRDLIAAAAAEAGVKPCLCAEFPHGVIAVKRDGTPNLIFVSNFNPRAVTVPLNAEYQDAESGQLLSGKLPLSAYEVRILTDSNSSN